MCTRTGLEDLVIADLTLAWFVENIDATTLDKIMFCGNLGDPCANSELLHICYHLKFMNPNIVLGINTNGGLRSIAWWQSLAECFNGIYDYVVFSIDGIKTNHLYRKTVSIEKIFQNAQAFIDAGGSAHWDMLAFKHNELEIVDCQEKAKEMGFTWFRGKESSRWDKYPVGIDGLFPINNNYMSYYELPEIDCEAERNCSRYYDANGDEWPCCHMAEAYRFNKTDFDIKKFTNTQLLDNYKERLKDEPYDICKKACGSNSRTGQWVREIEFNKGK
jgi:hypothetical protein